MSELPPHIVALRLQHSLRDLELALKSGELEPVRRSFEAHSTMVDRAIEVLA